jgi:hypothetical protein
MRLSWEKDSDIQEILVCSLTILHKREIGVFIKKKDKKLPTLEHMFLKHNFIFTCTNAVSRKSKR